MRLHPFLALLIVAWGGCIGPEATPNGPPEIRFTECPTTVGSIFQDCSGLVEPGTLPSEVAAGYVCTAEVDSQTADIAYWRREDGRTAVSYDLDQPGDRTYEVLLRVDWGEGSLEEYARTGPRGFIELPPNDGSGVSVHLYAYYMLTESAGESFRSADLLGMIVAEHLWLTYVLETANGTRYLHAVVENRDSSVGPSVGYDQTFLGDGWRFRFWPQQVAGGGYSRDWPDEPAALDGLFARCDG